MTKIFHPLLAMIASATNNELAKYIEYFKEENKFLRARIPGQIHTKPQERERLLKYGKVIGRAIEELITIVSPSSSASGTSTILSRSLWNTTTPDDRTWSETACRLCARSRRKSLRSRWTRSR